MDRHEEPFPVSAGRLRRVAKGLTPPVLVSTARRILGEGDRRLPEWECAPEGWDRAGAGFRGWNEQSVLDAYCRKLPAFRAAVDGVGPLAFATSRAIDMGTGNIVDQNTTLAFAYAILLASQGRTRVSVLDCGS